MSSGSILLETTGEAAVIYFNDPERLNAISSDMVDSLLNTVRKLEDNVKVRVVILRGKGGHFSSGANLRELEKASPEEALAFHRKMNEISRLIRHSGKVYISAYEGYALGGAFELSLSTDIRLSDEKSRIGQPEIRVGLNAGAGGNAILPKVIGKGNSMYMAMTGDSITAERAYQLGLVQAISKEGQLEQDLNGLVAKILEAPAVTAEEVKRTISSSVDDDSDRNLEREALSFSHLHSRKEVKEKIRKFLKK